MAEDSNLANLDDATSTKNALLKAAGIPKGIREKFNADRALANFDSQMENIVSNQHSNQNQTTEEDVASDDDTYSIGSDELSNENAGVPNFDSIPSDACLKKLMAEGKDLTQITEEGECLLSLASANGYLDLVQVMLAMNRDSVDERGPKNDLTPLMESVINGHEDCAKVLIEHGANVNAQSENGNTPLHFACSHGHVSLAKLLLQSGAGIEDQNENGHTPLMEAASNGLVDVARLLLERGAGINAYSNEFKESALTLACYKGHYDMVKFLLEAGADQDHQTEEMHTALMEACMDGHYDVAKLLIDHGAKVNMPTESFESPLTLAACGGHLQLANLLIEKGASLEEVNDEGYSPLMEAAREGHEAMVMLLVNCGANVNAQTEETQETALTLACYNGFINIAKFLLGTAGADVNGGGSSPLMEAAHQGHVDLVKFLISSGADIHLETGSGDTALSFACENGHNEVAEILLNYGAKLEHESEGGRTPLMKAARAGHVCTVQFLVSRGADVNRLSQNEDHTPLSLACSEDRKNVVELLLEHGADPSVRLKDGSNALIEATKSGNTQIVRLLLEFSPSMSDSLADTNELIYGSEIQPRVPTQALPNMVPPAQQNPIGLNVQRPSLAQKGNPVPCQIHNYNCPRNLNNAQLQQSTIPDVVQSAQESYVGSVAAAQQQYSNPMNSAQIAGHVCEHVHLNQSGKTYPYDDNSYHEKEQEIAKNLQKERDELLKKKAKLMNEKKEISKNVQQAARHYMEQQQAQNSSKLLTESQMTTQHWQQQIQANMFPPVVHDCLDPSSQCNQLPQLQPTHLNEQQPSTANKQSTTYVDPTSSSGSVGAASNLPSAIVAPCCEHHAQMAQQQQAFGDVKNPQNAAQNQPGSAGTQYLESGFSAANPLAGCNFSKNVGMPKVENSKQCLINNLNRPPGTGGGMVANPGNPRAVPVMSSQLINPALAGISFDQQLENFDVSNFAPLAMVPQYSMNSAGIDSAILEKLKQLPESEQRKLLELTTTLATAIDNSHLLPYFSQQSAAAAHLTSIPQPQQQQQQQSSKSPPSVTQSSSTTPATNQQTSSTPANLVPSTSSPTPQQQAIATTFAAAAAAAASHSPGGILSPESLATLNQTLSMENVLNAAGLIAAASADSCVDPSQAVFDLLNQGCAGDKMTADQQLVCQFGRMELEPDQQETSQSGDLLLAPNPSPTEGVGTPNRSTSPCENIAATQSYIFRPGEMYPPGTAPAGILPAGVIPSFQGMTPEQIIALNSQTANTSTQTANLAGQAVMMQQALPHQQHQQGHELGLNNGLPMAVNSRSLVEVNAQTDSNNDTPLTIAAAAGNRDIVRELLKSKADIEHKDKKGFTPLILAASGGHVDVVRLLLETEAQLEATSERTKDTALSLACSGGKEEVVCVLLEKGANIEHRNVSDYTPLSLAASGGYIKIIKMLLNAGAEINSRTGSRLGISPLMLAAMNGHSEAVKLLLDHGSDINAQIESNRNTALTLACYQGRHEVVSLLLERRANMEHRAKSGLTPLMEAASGGYADVGRVLLDHGADVNAPPVPASRDTALTIAADKGHYNFCEVVVARGANVEARNKKGGTPLWLACNGGHLDVAMMLVTSGADVDAQDNRKISCLMAAFRRGHVKVLRYLVKKVSQFPGNQECLRYIATLSDNDLIKRCNQCLDIITNAKDKQAEQANKNATSLLQELDDEKCREEKQKEAAARKREKRRQKKKQQKSNNNTSNANSQEQETNEHNKDSQEEDANDSKDADSIPVKSSAEEQETELQRSGGSSGKGGLSSSGRKSRIVRGDGITSDLEPKDEVDDETDFDTLLGLVDNVSLSSSGGNSSSQAMLIRSNNSTAISTHHHATSAASASSTAATNNNNASSSSSSNNSVNNTCNQAQVNNKKRGKRGDIAMPKTTTATRRSKNKAPTSVTSYHTTAWNHAEGVYSATNPMAAVVSAAEKSLRETSSSSSANNRSAKSGTGSKKKSSSRSASGGGGVAASGSNGAKKPAPSGNQSTCGVIRAPFGDEQYPNSSGDKKSPAQVQIDVVIENGPLSNSSHISPSSASQTSKSHPNFNYQNSNIHYSSASSAGSVNSNSSSSNHHTSAGFTQAAKGVDQYRQDKLNVPLHVNLSPNGVPTSNSSGYLSVTPGRSSGGSTTNISPRKPTRRGEEGWKEVTQSRKSSMISKKTVVPGSAISRVIGRQGCNINAIREATCAHIEIDKQNNLGGTGGREARQQQQQQQQQDRNPHTDRIVNIRGSAESVKWAEKLIDILIQDPTVDITEHIPKNLAQSLNNNNNTTAQHQLQHGSTFASSYNSIVNSTGSITGTSIPNSVVTVGHYSSNQTTSAKKPPISMSFNGIGSGANYPSQFGASSANSAQSVGSNSFGIQSQRANQQQGLGLATTSAHHDLNRTSANTPGKSSQHLPSFGVIGSRNVGSRTQAAVGAQNSASAQSAWKAGDVAANGNNNNNVLNAILNQGPSPKIWQSNVYVGSSSEKGVMESRSYGGFQGAFERHQASAKESNQKSSSSKTSSGVVMGPKLQHPPSQQMQPGSIQAAGLSHSVNIPLDTLFGTNNNTVGTLNLPESEPSSLFSSVNTAPIESGQGTSTSLSDPMGTRGGLNIGLHYQNTSPTGVSRTRHPSGGSGNGVVEGTSPKVSPPEVSSKSGSEHTATQTGNQPGPFSSVAPQMTPQKDPVIGGGTMSDSGLGTLGNQPQLVGSEKKHAPIGFERKAPTSKNIQSHNSHSFSSLGGGNNTHLGSMYSSLDPTGTSDLFAGLPNFGGNLEKATPQLFNPLTSHPHAQNAINNVPLSHHHLPSNFLSTQHAPATNAHNPASFYPSQNTMGGVPGPTNDPVQNNPIVSSVGTAVGVVGQPGSLAQQMSGSNPPGVGSGASMIRGPGDSVGHLGGVGSNAASVASAVAPPSQQPPPPPSALHSHSIPNLYSSQQTINGTLSVSQQLVAPANSHQMTGLAPGSGGVNAVAPPPNMSQYRVNPSQFYPGNPHQSAQFSSHHSTPSLVGSNPNGPPPPNMVNPLGGPPMHNGGFLPFGATPSGNPNGIGMNSALGLSSTNGREANQAFNSAPGAFTPFLSAGAGMECDSRGMLIDDRSLNLNLASHQFAAHNGGTDTMFPWSQSGVGSGNDYNPM